MKKVYFCGSIRGGREDASLYHEIIEILKQKYIVLTEHIGEISLKETISDSEIYKRDIDFIEESDLVIAECTTPSLGVGYELSYAEKRKKEVHVFYDRSRTSLSAMINGDSYFIIHPYESNDELIRLISEFIDD